MEREIRALIQAIKDGVSALAIRNELMTLEARKAELTIALIEPPLPALHPRAAQGLPPEIDDALGRLGARRAARRRPTGPAGIPREDRDSTGGRTAAGEGKLVSDVGEPQLDRTWSTVIRSLMLVAGAGFEPA